MNTVHIDKLNTGLLFLSFVLAYMLPFNLFLFVYAVLGPLHYLTEIAWLKEHNYFSQRRHDGSFLMVFGILITLIASIPILYHIVPAGVLLAVAFGTSVVFLLSTSLRMRLLVLGICGVSAYVLSGFNIFFTLFAVLLPTIIHVYIFTGLFMLYGALKSKSMFGFINVILLVFLGGLFFVLPTVFSITPTASVIESYQHSFGSLSQQLAVIFGNSLVSTADMFFTEVGVSIMQFIAFAYTYHYLNWFSKTKVIRWGESARKYQNAIIILWAASVGIYAYSFTLGFAVLFYLSITHVLLEFPLNHKTIGALFQSFRRTQVPVQYS